MSLADSFNSSGFSRFINSSSGRLFRLLAGAGFLSAGLRRRDRPLGLLLMAWSALPLSAGALDMCFISAALGGPLSGEEIRAGHPTRTVATRDVAARRAPRPAKRSSESRRDA